MLLKQILRTIITSTIVITDSGNSLVVQWLGLRAFTAVIQVRSLFKELRTRWYSQTAQTNDNNENKNTDSGNPQKWMLKLFGRRKDTHIVSKSPHRLLTKGIK